MTIVDNRCVGFFRKTKSSGKVKIARENYLRDDIGCGVAPCTLCTNNMPINITELPGLDVPGVIIPDFRVLAVQIDLFENQAIKDVIVLQTALETIKVVSIVLYNRIMDLVTNPDKRFYMFCNDYHYETFYGPSYTEITEKRSMMAAIKAALWYNRHLKGLGVAYLITDSDDIKAEGDKAGVNCLTMLEYVEKRPDADELVDIVVSMDYKDIVDVSPYRYPEHLSMPQTMAGIKSKELYEGVLKLENYNTQRANVICNIQGEEVSVLINGRENMNRSIDNDIVAISLLPKSEWISEVPGAIEDDDYESDVEEKRYMSKDIDNLEVPKAPCGRVVSIIRRKTNVYCGSFDEEYITSNMKDNLSKVKSLFFWPISRNIPRIMIRTRQAQRLVNKRIAVAIDGWPADSRFPVGHYIKTIGDIGSKETETETILMEHNIEHAPFPPKILSLLPPEGESWKVTDADMVGREDLTKMCVFTIDPLGCTDMDDALHFRQLPNGNYEVGIHIADVTHFVKPNTPLDDEAKKRSTTVYLVDRRIDMIPDLLGSNICSIREAVKRLALSCIVELDDNANVVKTSFCRSVILSRVSLTYHQAQIMISGHRGSNSSDVYNSIRMLDKLAKKLRAKRIEGGALALSSEELNFDLGENSESISSEVEKSTDSKQLVEDFMLLANIEVAKKIYSKYHRFSLLRRHPAPSPARFDVLKNALAKLGYNLDTSSSKALAQSLEKISESSDGDFDNLVKMLVTRCMTRAEYFPSGSLTEKDFWHYGLAVPIYTHFTSPIRRYPDVIVHRILCASIGIGEVDPFSEYPNELMLELCENMNHKHYQAQVAQRSSNLIFTNLIIKDNNLIEEAHVSRILANGICVITKKHGLEGVIKRSTENKSHSDITFLPDKQVVLESGKIVLELFQKVKVKVGTKAYGHSALKRSRIAISLVEPSIQELEDQDD